MLKGIKYTKIAGEEFYLQEVFPDEERTGSLISQLVKSDRPVYEYNTYDSKVERDFAQALQNDKDVVVYTKLPTKKFVVPTPIGDYTPDWAVVINKDGTQKLYFVVETKYSIDEENLRKEESLKSKFGAKRFADVGGAGYIFTENHTMFKKGAAVFSDSDGKTQIE